jgi:hypothetical protein
MQEVVRPEREMENAHPRFSGSGHSRSFKSLQCEKHGSTQAAKEILEFVLGERRIEQRAAAESGGGEYGGKKIRSVGKHQRYRLAWNQSRFQQFAAKFPKQIVKAGIR